MAYRTIVTINDIATIALLYCRYETKPGIDWIILMGLASMFQARFFYHCRFYLFKQRVDQYEWAQSGNG